MREIERYVILQVVDSRWRGHLDSMDYLRDGIHLRAMAQKDPLAEYRAEGHAMFNELRNTIREEVVLTLFHAQVELEPEQLEAQPTNGNVQYQHETAAGSEAIAAAGAGSGSGLDLVRAAGDRRQRDRDRRERAQGRRPQRPLLVRLGQEVQALPRRVK